MNTKDVMGMLTMLAIVVAGVIVANQLSKRNII